MKASTSGIVLASFYSCLKRVLYLKIVSLWMPILSCLVPFSHLGYSPGSSFIQSQSSDGSLVSFCSLGHGFGLSL